MVCRYNQVEERLEVCLGVDHVPVGPLTREQLELARLAAVQNNEQKPQYDESSTDNTASGEFLIKKINVFIYS